ncbi:MAG: TOBE domain-containing protein [Thermodesulfobacteriota bacterium]
MARTKGKRRGAVREQDTTGFNPAGLLSLAEGSPCLDTLELARLEAAFRKWAAAAPSTRVAASRRRVLLIFLVIRHAGARLGEALSLDLSRDLTVQGGTVNLGNREKQGGSGTREVPVPPSLLSELAAGSTEGFGPAPALDPAHVRRKFYERAADCGLSPELASPNAVRRARAVELMREGAPLPLVQRLLGQASPNLAGCLVTLSDKDAKDAARHFLARESRRFTSARNTFFGKVARVREGDIQSLVILETPAGFVIRTIITNTSREKLRLGKDALCTAEVKAPFVVIVPGRVAPETSAENVLAGTVSRITRGNLSAEVILTLTDGTELCSVTTAESAARLGLSPGDPAFACFGAFHVVLERMM